METLANLLTTLEEIAPLELAEEWDNVGLLLEPERSSASLRAVTLTVDLSPAVTAQVTQDGTDLVLAYHPPIFGGLKRLAQSDPRQRDLLALIQNGIAVYSPHTALDSTSGGVNDWLAEAFDPAEVEILQPSLDRAGCGQGRRLTLEHGMVLGDCVDAIKEHLGLANVRVATADNHARGEPVETIALCPGAGGSVIGSCDADLLWTGEMRHHDVLEANAHGRSVVLCEHTNTERGYLSVLADRLRERHPDVEFNVAADDRDPLGFA